LIPLRSSLGQSFKIIILINYFGVNERLLQLAGRIILTGSVPLYIKKTRI
jgi:hypothetical protein